MQEQDGPVALSGSLSVTPLMSLCTTIEANGKSALLRLTTELGLAKLWFRDGTLLDAEFDGSVGEQALSRILSLDDGRFEVVFMDVTRARAIHASPNALAQRRRARGDEWARLAEQGPSLNAILHVDYSAIGESPLPPSQRSLLPHFDGQRCVIDVIDRAGRDAVEALRDIVVMTNQGVLRVGQSYSQIPPATVSGLDTELEGLLPRPPAVPRFDFVPPSPDAAHRDQTPGSRYSTRPGTVEVVWAPGNVHRSAPPSSSHAPATARLGTDLGILTPANTARGSDPAISPDADPRPAMASDPTAQKPGVFLGKYEVLCRLGRGGMGTVYLCRVTGAAGFRRLYALKVLRQRMTEGSTAERRFLAEAFAASRLTHPNVVSVVDANIHLDQPYVVLDYVEGCSLSTLLLRSPDRRPPELIVPVLLDALNGLAAAHDLTDDAGRPLQLVHCDISPDNLLVGVDGVCRITDFGMARFGAAADPTGISRGKAGYVSPEQVQGLPVDSRSDVFSLGIVFWNALTGRQLFLAPSAEEILRNVLEAEIPPPSRVGLRPPAVLDPICLRALERDPAKRFQSAGEMVEVLRRIAGQNDLLGAPSEIARWVRAAFGPELQQRRLASLDASRRVALGERPSPTLPRSVTDAPPPAEPPEATTSMASDGEDPAPDTQRPGRGVGLSRLRNGVVIGAAVIAFAIIALSVLKPNVMAKWFRIETADLLVEAGAPSVSLPLVLPPGPSASTSGRIEPALGGSGKE